VPFLSHPIPATAPRNEAMDLILKRGGGGGVSFFFWGCRKDRREPIGGSQADSMPPEGMDSGARRGDGWLSTAGFDPAPVSRFTRSQRQRAKLLFWKEMGSRNTATSSNTVKRERGNARKGAAPPGDQRYGSAISTNGAVDFDEPDFPSTQVMARAPARSRRGEGDEDSDAGRGGCGGGFRRAPRIECGQLLDLRLSGRSRHRDRKCRLELQPEFMKKPGPDAARVLGGSKV